MLNGIHQAFNNRPLRRVLFYARFPLALLACYALATQVNPALYYRGLAVSFIGACLQWWCFACLKKQKVIAVNGPYGFVRNPMYLARYLLILGGVLMIGNLWISLGFTVVYYFYMVNRVGREEKKLAGIFGEDYARYCRDVPRFVPTLRKHPDGQPIYFSWATFQENHGLVNALGVFAAYAALWIYLFHCPC